MPKIPKYSKEQLDNALEDINQGIPLRTAAKKYGIPRATLQFKLKNPTSKNDFGPSPYLTNEEEQLLEDWICDMGRRGFPRNVDDILDSVQKFLFANPRETPFANNRPGKGWLKGFLKRHPRITQRTGEAVTYASACVTEKDIRNWFAEVTCLLEQTGLNSVLEDPSRIFNADESGFQTCPTTGRVFAEKGEKNVYIVDKGKAKESMTVLFTVSADGENILPTIVYPYQRLPDRIKQSVPKELSYAISPSGWMTADTFKYIIEHIFHPFLVKKNTTFPVLLFVDGHKSHLTYDLSVLASSLQIEIFALYPNATRILQPADVSLFKPVKQYWKSAVREWMMENEEEVVTKQNFALVLKKVTDKIKPSCIINGFRACGLYPFNPDSVDYSKCVAKASSTTTTDSLRDQTDKSEKNMTFRKFKELIGKETVTKFEQIKKILPDIQNNEYFFVLYRLWEYYTENELEERTVNETENTTQLEERTVNETENTTQLEERTVNETKNTTQEKEAKLKETDEPKTKDVEREAIEATKDIEVIEEKSNNTADDTDDEYDNRSQHCFIITEKAQVHTSNDSTEKNRTITKTGVEINKIDQSNFDAIERENKIYTKTLEPDDLITPQDLGTEEEAFPSQDPRGSLKDFLHIPPEPARKGRRNILRLPFHISGTAYQKILEEKAKEKENIEKEKRQRKIQREQNKIDRKRKAEEIKAVKINNKKKMFNQSCDICKKNVKKGNLTCSQCKCNFHKRCVPKSHREHIPEEERDSYLCHNCYIVTENSENEDENNENYISDKDSDHEFLCSLNERQFELGFRPIQFK